MKQIIENSLIAGTLFILIVLPFIILSRKLKKKREAGMLNKLNEAAHDYGLKLTRYIAINNNLIGWDKENAVLLFALDEERPEYIKLDGVGRCYTLKKMNGRAVRSISLELQDRNGRLINSIPFYRQFTDSEMTLKKALKYAAEWELLVVTDIKERDSKLVNLQRA
ncbi:MAG: hypothetical protein V4456_11945 [Bacteroidota bacterium]